MSTIPYYPLKNSASLDPLLDQIGDNVRVVMLGEASHGTSEYYTWRAAISRRLILEKGFNFIGVEGDWPDCYAINRFIKGYKDAGKDAIEVLQQFKRWPTWMWGNWEIASLMDWLKDHNANTPDNRKVGFFGLDMYSLWESLEQIIHFLERRGDNAAEIARKAIECFQPFGHDPQKYARATAGFVPFDCADEVVDMLKQLRNKQLAAPADAEEAFNTEQNALVAVNAEKFYRTMIKGGPESWNVRDRHMTETLDRLLKYHGPDAKAIVWEHNTHIGDARATDMADEGMVNIGQLGRELYGKDNVFLAGFGSYKGTVIAGDEWDAPMEVMPVPEACEGSWERMLHNISPGDKLILCNELNDIPELDKRIGHRAIGVVYHPQYERFGNFVPTVIPKRYDAFLYIDKTEALHPFEIHEDLSMPPELYPWNF
jgi:erythromycin esterase-like protein